MTQTKQSPVNPGRFSSHFMEGTVSQSAYRVVIIHSEIFLKIPENRNTLDITA